MELIYSAITIFGMTAIAGMYLLSLILRNKETPKGIAFIHGVLAVIALVLLIIFSINNPEGPIVSIVIFVIAALGGLMLIYKDLTKEKVPVWLGIVHGVTAVVGFIFLIVYAINH